MGNRLRTNCNEQIVRFIRLYAMHIFGSSFSNSFSYFDATNASHRCRPPPRAVPGDKDDTVAAIATIQSGAGIPTDMSIGSDERAATRTL